MNRELYPLLSVIFIGSFGLSVVLPFLVFLVQDFGGNSVIYGLMGATYPFFQLIGAPLLGKWSDVYGRKKILLVSQAGTMLSWGIFIYALYLPIDNLGLIDSEVFGTFNLSTPLILIFTARAVDGLTGGNISVANAYLGDISSTENRKANFGKMSAASSLGFIAGPAIAGALAGLQEGYSLPALRAMAISLIGLVIIILWLKETDREPDNDGLKTSRSLRALLKIKHVPLMFLLYFLIFLGFNFFYTAFPVHASSTMGWSASKLGYYFSALSVLMVLVQGPFMSRMSKYFNDYVLLISGSFILSIQFFLLIPASDSLAYLAILFFALGNGVMWPSYLAILSACGTKSQQGSIQGYGSSFGSLASILGLILGGFLYGIISTYTFLIAGSIIFIVALLSFRSKKISTDE